MTITDTSTHIELDCAYGDIPGPFSVDADNRFSLIGTFVREHGGPIHQGQVPDAHPATYAGGVSSDHLTLTIQQTDSDETVGTFTLIRGRLGGVMKCL